MATAREMTVAVFCLTAFWLGLSPAPVVAGEKPPASANKKTGPVLKAGDPIPSFALKVLNPDQCGRQMLSSKHHVGSKPRQPVRAMLISFASVYCKPCMKEMPELQKLHETLGSSGLLVLVVDIDREAEDIEAVKSLVAREKFTFPVLSDRFALVARRYGADELPMMIVADGSGSIRWMKVGYEASVIEELAGVLKPMLAPNAGSEEEAPAPESTAIPAEVAP